MSDPRRELQADFAASTRFERYGEVLERIRIKGFRNHADTTINVESPIVALCGVNGTGKSTVLQLAAAAYQSKQRYYISTFILAGGLEHKPFREDASVEFFYSAQPGKDGNARLHPNTVSRAGDSWTGYDRQPERHVRYIGTGFYLPHSERSADFKQQLEDADLTARERKQVQADVVERVSEVLLCKYDAAHRNVMSKKYARWSIDMLSVQRPGCVEYTEANMGSGEARLCLMVTSLEAAPEKSLILLEEPETALHPSAQFELGKYLVGVAKRRRLQILLTTHSEYVLLALPESSRVFLKREGTSVVPIPRIGVRQAVSMMDSLAIPSIYILVEDEIAEAIVTELLRMHDSDFLKTARVFAAGDKGRIAQMMDVFKDQRIPICAVRDGDCGENGKLQLFKLFGSEPPEKEMFKSESFRKRFSDTLKVDWGAADIANKEKDHHSWFDPLETQTRLNRGELIALAARAYLEGIPEADRKALVAKIKASAP